MKKYYILCLIVLLAISQAPVFAQDKAESQSQPEEKVDATYEERIELATKMHDLRPVRAQVEGAIDRYAETRPANERESFKTAMRSVFNLKALEKISVDAYAETFTVEELRSMVEYYSKPEARSASDKYENYAAIVYPEIVRMLDRAAIRLKTGE